MSLKDNLDTIMKNFTYGIIILLWGGFTFLCFVNIENYYEKSIESLVVAVCAPFAMLILFGAFCAIVWYRIDTRMTAIDKIGRDESWDFFETIEMINMFNEIFE